MPGLIAGQLKTTNLKTKNGAKIRLDKKIMCDIQIIRKIIFLNLNNNLGGLFDGVSVVCLHNVDEKYFKLFEY